MAAANSSRKIIISNLKSSAPPQGWKAETTRLSELPMDGSMLPWLDGGVQESHGDTESHHPEVDQLAGPFGR